MIARMSTRWVRRGLWMLALVVMMLAACAPLASASDTVTLSGENGHFTLDGPVCQVAVNHAWWDTRTRYEMEEILVHEDFHCYEHQIAPAMSRVVGDDGSAKNEGDWIIEGLAKWVDLTFFPLVGEG